MFQCLIKAGSRDVFLKWKQCCLQHIFMPGKTIKMSNENIILFPAASKKHRAGTLKHQFICFQAQLLSSR
jgi:hypothetical protein